MINNLSRFLYGFMLCWSSTARDTHDHSPIAQGKTMAELQETQQEKEARWATQRTARETQQQTWRATRAGKRRKAYLITGGIVTLLVVIGAALLM
jgi:CHASE3 domain sensor protein